MNDELAKMLPNNICITICLYIYGACNFSENIFIECVSSNNYIQFCNNTTTS